MKMHVSCKETPAICSITNDSPSIEYSAVRAEGHSFDVAFQTLTVSTAHRRLVAEWRVTGGGPGSHGM